MWWKPATEGLRDSGRGRDGVLYSCVPGSAALCWRLVDNCGAGDVCFSLQTFVVHGGR